VVTHHLHHLHLHVHHHHHIPVCCGHTPAPRRPSSPLYPLKRTVDCWSWTGTTVNSPPLPPTSPIPLLPPPPPPSLPLPLPRAAVPLPVRLQNVRIEC
jgi:hypothetical protein